MTEAREPNEGHVARGTDARSNETPTKAPVGGFVVSFETKSRASLEELFGTKPLTVSEMTYKLWQYIKKNGLYVRQRP